MIVFRDGEKYWLVDGFHRFTAARKAGRTEIECVIYAGKLADARWFSYSANQTHGLRRSNADKVRAVTSALRHRNAKSIQPCGLPITLVSATA